MVPQLVVCEIIVAEIILGGRPWMNWAVGLAAVALVAVLWSYIQANYATWTRVLAALLKTVGIVLLAALLLEPMFRGTRARPGSKLFMLVGDKSESLQIGDRSSRESRGALMKERLDANSSWMTRLAQDFDVRRYAFDASLRPLKDFSELTLDGEASALRSTLTALGERFRGQPIGGILLLTD